MKVLKNENVIMYDVDDTLVIWKDKNDETDRVVVIEDPYLSGNPYGGNKAYALAVHEPHVKLLQNHHARGKCVVVWSQGGYRWAEAVVKALGLEDCVDLIMSKPTAYVDDLRVEEWLPKRTYISADSNWGANADSED